MRQTLSPDHSTGETPPPSPRGAPANAPVKNALGSQIAADMVLFTQIAVNPAKHDYTDNSGQGPVFCYDDAVYAYFLARRFGCAALQSSGELTNLVEAVADSTRQDRYFWELPCQPG